MLPGDSSGGLGPGPRGGGPAGPLRGPGSGQLASGTACGARGLAAPVGGGVDTLSGTALGSDSGGRLWSGSILSGRPGPGSSLLGTSGSLKTERY